MSELQAICETLSAIDGDILQMAQDLHGKAQAYSRAAASAAAAARSAEGEAAAALARTANALSAAARHCGQAASSLTGASREGQAYVQRTVGAGGPNGAASSASTTQATVGTRARERASDLSPDDRAALSDYTGDGYKSMNSMLRGESRFDVDTAKRCTALSAALEKLPNYSGMVVRGRNLTKTEDIESYRVGAVLRERGFTSADTTTPFAGNTVFVIHSKSGKDISEYSTFGADSGGREHEVLFDAGTKFEVLSHVIVNGRRRIVMKEV